MFRIEKSISERCRVALCLLALATFAGCASRGAGSSQPTARHQPPGPQYDLSTAQDQIADFADNYMTTVGGLFADIEQDYRNRPELRREALRSWLMLTRAAMINATDHNPVYGMVNMVIFVRLERYSYAQPWFEQTFGARAAAAAREIMGEQDRRISALAGQYITPAQADELRAAIESWIEKQPPLRATALARLEDLAVARGPEQTAKSSPTSIFSLAFGDPLASLDPAVREVNRSRLAARRMFYYAQRAPAILRLEAKLLSLDVLAEPQVSSAIENIGKLNSNATDFVAVSRQFSDHFANIAANLSAEREETIAQLNDALTTQRGAAIKQLAEATAKERDAAIQQIAAATAKERAATIEQLTSSVDRLGGDLIKRVAQATASEREAALHEVDTTVSGQQRAAWTDADAASKAFLARLVVGLCLSAGIIAVIVALVVLAYRWTASRIIPTAAPPRG